MLIIDLSVLFHLAMVDDVTYWLSGMTIKAEDDGFYHKISDLDYFRNLEKKVKRRFLKL